jgi:hypothetical protein
VQGPDWRSWEIYSYRLKLPARGDTFDPDSFLVSGPPGGAEAGLLLGAVYSML